jgi:signal transduction histidine kinase
LLKKKIKIILLIDLILLIIAGTGILHLSHRPGLYIKFAHQNDSLVVVGILDSPLIGVVKSGDILIDVDNRKINKKEEIEFVCDRHSIDDTIELGLVRNASVVRVTAVLYNFYSLSYIIILVIVGIFYFSIGVFVFLKRPEDKVALVFHCITVATAIIMTTTWGKYTFITPWLGTGLRCVNSAAYAFTPAFFVHLSLIYLNPMKKHRDQLIGTLYSISVVLTLWMVVSFISAVYIDSLTWFNHFLTGFNTNRLYFAAAMFFGVANFFYSYQKAREESERRKLRWVLLGLILGPLGFVTLWQIPEVLTSNGLVPEEFVLLIAAIAPTTFAIAIVKYHLMDVDLIINRSTVYIIVIILILILYTVIVGTIAFIIGRLTVESSIIVSAISAVIIALLFEPVKEKVQTLIDEKFFRVRYNYRLTEREITDKIDTYYDIISLADFILEKIDKILHIEQPALLYRDETASRWKIVGDKNCNRYLDSISGDLKNIVTTQEYIEAGIIFQQLTPDICREPGIVLILPVQSQQGGNSAYLLLGRKKSATRYSLEDIDLLKTVVRQFGIAMDRIYLQNRLIIQNAETVRLKELNDLKSFFVSSVSHDLQTPLTSIKMFAELLQTKKNITGENRKEYLQIIEGESSRLSRLIRNVLDFSKIERGVKTYHIKKTNIIESIHSVVRLMKYPLQQSGFKTEIDMPQGEIYIQADGDAIIEALTNLIANAIKFSPDEKYIAIQTELTDENVFVHIKDKGIGISEKERDSIFETFYRADTRENRNKGGLGLGLTIVQHIVNSHKGTITVSSIPGKGSTFSLAFPRMKE